MTKEKLDEQISCLLAVYYITLEAANVMSSKIELLMWKNNQAFAQEAKKYMSFIKQGMQKTKYGLDFFQDNALPTLVTDEGKSDYNSTSEALLKDANQIARTLCQMYNENVKSTKISESIINDFNLKQYENEGTDNPGNSKAK